MSEFKGTPGPWSAEESCNEDGEPYWSDDMNAVVWCVATPATADTATWLIDSIRREDARLIAAAPDLLEALENLLQAYIELADSGDAGFWDARDTEEGKNAAAAIAKALQS